MKEKNILANKYYLYLTEFFAGMSVMAVELGASRLLAPYFSSSQIVWTIIIGTIMIAMALGNIYGGRSADKHPDPSRLYRRVIIAAIWIAAIPVLGKYVILAISAALIFTVNNNLLIWSAFFTCMIIFVFPLFLLGTVTPSLVKYTVDSLDDSGRVVGTLGAFNTIGSIIGTFVPTFVTIPTVGTSMTFLIFSGILLVLGALYFISIRKGKVICCIGIIAFIACSLLGYKSNFAFWEKNLVYEGESIYNYLQVKEDSENVILATNVLFGVQSIMKKNGELTGLYYDYALAAPIIAEVNEKEAPKMLILGMGTGTYATQCKRYFDDISIEGVEIDEKITRLAEQYFNLPEDVKVTTYDGRAYLNAIDEKYDVIMVDAYQDITIPFQMSSIEFFTMVKEHLTDDGVMVVNMNMTGQQEGNINEYLMDTIANVFPNIYFANVDGTSNREVFAMREPLNAEAFNGQVAKLQDPSLQNMMAYTASKLMPYEKGEYLMTDDNAPVELLGMKMIDELIRNEVSYYKGIYKEKGISGLLQEI